MNNDINSLYAVRTVSGAEHGMKGFIKQQLSDYCDEIFSDSIGNVYAIKKGTGSEPRKTVALVCAVDEPGFVVTYIEDDGKIRLHGIGAKNWSKFLNVSAGSADGTCGILLSSVQDTSKIGADDLYLETGAESSADVILAEGDFVYIDQPPKALGKNKISLGIMGGKVFASALADIAKCSGDYCFDLCLIFAGQHLLGGRGEKCAAYTAGADAVIALTTVDGKFCAGDGAVICTADSGGKCSRSLLSDLYKAADGIGVKYRKHSEINKEQPSFIAPFIAENTHTAIMGCACEKSECGANICDLRDIRGAAAIACSYLIFRDENEENTNE